MRVFHGDPAQLAAPDPILSSELLQFVAEQYDLCVDTSHDLGGSFNLNVLVDEHVIRVYGPWVNADRGQELQRLRQELKQENIPIPSLRPALDGSLWFVFDGCFLEVERYIQGKSMGLGEQFHIGMHMLGRLHTLMAGLTLQHLPPIANHLPQELALDATLDVTSFIRAWNPTHQEEHWVEIAERLANLLPVIELPQQVVHGDFWDNNVLFGETDVMAVLDFDFAGIRPRIDDLALPLCYAVQSGIQLTEVRKFVEAYNAGCSTPLSDAERRALPFAMARMALFFLQYLLLPPLDEAYAKKLRQEFNEQRGPACEWWLDQILEGTLSEELFL